MRGQSIRVQHVCQHCGTTFWPKPSNVRAGYGKYCSHRCHYAARPPRSPGILCHCEQCGVAFFAAPKDVRNGYGKYCSHACAGIAKTRLALAKFWERVDMSGDCWPWMGARFPQGYGAFGWDGRQRKTHRIAWELTYGPIPAGLFVCHHCDNPPCCRPDHLFLGTAKDNSADKVAKGRQAHLAGELASGARLTGAQVLDIRARVARGEKQRDIARELDVSPATICMLVKRKTWRHID